MPSEDPRRIVGRIYRDLDGYLIPPAEERAVRRARSQAVYGEIMPTATLRLLDHLEPGPEDVLYDLGSGVGRFVVQAAIAYRLRRVVGIELSRTRHRVAERAYARAAFAGALRSPLSLVHGDFMREPFEEATLVYACATLFPEPLMWRLQEKLGALPEGTRFASVRELEPSPWLEWAATLRLDMSWRRKSPVHVYRVRSSRTCSRPDRRSRSGPSGSTSSR